MSIYRRTPDGGRLLIPREVAAKGAQAIEKWLAEQQAPKESAPEPRAKAPKKKETD